MIEVKCKETCYDSTSCRRYEKGRTYMLDEGMVNPWYASHFELPKDLVTKEIKERIEEGRRKKAENAAK